MMMSKVTWNSPSMTPLLSCFEFHFLTIVNVPGLVMEVEIHQRLGHLIMKPSGSMMNMSATSSYGRRSV